MLSREELLRAWEASLRAMPASVGLRMAHFSLYSRHFHEFSASGMRDLGARAIKALDAAPSGVDEAVRERGLLPVIVRLAHMERAAGYDERGVALFQAIARRGREMRLLTLERHWGESLWSTLAGDRRVQLLLPVEPEGRCAVRGAPRRLRPFLGVGRATCRRGV